LAEQLQLERELQRIAGQSDNYKEGVAAFIEKS
jgi:2-(1,2-epoxy-1,2-dihydrophenyl)acetyl-CoA isomerase